MLSGLKFTYTHICVLIEHICVHMFISIYVHNVFQMSTHVCIQVYEKCICIYIFIFAYAYFLLIRLLIYRQIYPRRQETIRINKYGFKTEGKVQIEVLYRANLRTRVLISSTYVNIGGICLQVQGWMEQERWPDSRGFYGLAIFVEC